MENKAMMNVVVSIGMGPGQLCFLKRLSELGYNIVAFGKGKNSAEAMKLCCYTAEIDTKDFEAAVKWIDSLPVKVVAVGSFAGGMAVTTVQRIANYYKVSTAVPEELIVGSDKLKQQKLYNEYKLSSIKTWKANELTKTILQNMDDETFILKPAVGRGSEGIAFINKESLINSIDSLNDEDVIQVVRRGTEYRCLILVQDKKIKLLAPILRQSYRDTVFLGVLSYSQKDIDRLTVFVEKFITGANIKNSIIKTDIIVSENNIDVIEMDIGVGGGSYFKTFISRIYDCNLMDEYIKLISGQEVSCFTPKRPALRMEYVYNHRPLPIKYDLNACQDFYNHKYGNAEIQVNTLHPEKTGGYSSNADFIFTVMYESEQSLESFGADESANTYLFSIDEGV